MLRIPNSPPLTVLRDYLRQAGYSTSRMQEELGLSMGLFADLSNLEVLLEKTTGEDLMHVLSRLFFLGWPVARDLCGRHMPDSILQLCVEANVVAIENGEVSPRVVIVPFEHLLCASDAPRLRASIPENVIGPSSTTHILTQTMLRTPADTLLDVGTGSGVLSGLAANYCREVTGTDVNERAVEFARFNAALNGVTNAQFLAGSAFEPIGERRFARIVANPPFFLTPGKKFTYSDSPLVLDGFTRKLAMEAPEHLQDGGIFQMICEWVEVEGERWEDRLRSWTNNRGCDVLVFQGPTNTPTDYAERRHKESKTLNVTDVHGFVERLEYFREHRVTNILSGVVNMRRRPGSNWFQVVTGDLTVQSGKAIEERFAAFTTLAESTDEKLLASQFRIAPGAVLTQTFLFEDSEWKLDNMGIANSHGVKDGLFVDGPVLATVSMFDGRRSLAEIVQRTAERLSIDQNEARNRCLNLTKRLLRGAFISAN